MSGYSEHDQQRRVAESAKQAALLQMSDGNRSAFARDRARVLHSAALRRLAGKTQVVGPGEGAEISGVPRTRLTHSLEVAQIGREIAEELGANPDIVDAAGLAHDIGHPPFGHNGEQALNEIAAECGGFEANAQTLRILTRLEPKLTEEPSTISGLNLTRATLDAATKYPWLRQTDNNKFGVYADDEEIFRWFRAGTPHDEVCLEAQIMDWADDVAYSVHDVEDGVLTGRISLQILTDSSERRALAELAATNFTTLAVSTVESSANELLSSAVIVDLVREDYDSSMRAQVGLKRLTSELVGRFTTAAITDTKAKFGADPLSRYAAHLVIPEQVIAEVAFLKALAFRYVMSDPQRLAIQRSQRELLTELVWWVNKRAPDSLDAVYRQLWQSASDDASRLRVIVDQVASLTDSQAYAWHARRKHHETI